MRTTAPVRTAASASVTLAPVRRWISQASLVVTTPSWVRCRRIQDILGAAKYGSRGRPVSCRNSSACGASSVQTGSARRSCRTRASVSGRPVAGSRASTFSPWLARPSGTTGSRASDPGPAARVEHRAVQLLRVDLHQAAGKMAGVHLGEPGADDAALGADDQRLGAGRALVDREDRTRHRASPPSKPSPLRRPGRRRRSLRAGLPPSPGAGRRPKPHRPGGHQVRTPVRNRAG